MKAWLLERFDGISSLRLGDVVDPHPAAGEAVLEIEYAALNPADRYLAQGQYPAKPSLPHILGRDGIGRVVEIGAGISALKQGDIRAVLRGETGVTRWGTFAQRVAVTADSLVEVPAGWSKPQAACAPLVYLTAFQALTQWGALEPSVVLITGASGGVGVAATQLASIMGHTVVALSRNETKQRQLRHLGAKLTLSPEDLSWPARLNEQLAGRRVDLAIDNIGGSLFSKVIGTLGAHGRVSAIGRLAGPVPEFNTASLFFRRIRIGGVAVGAYTTAESRAAWSDLVALMHQADAKPQIDRVFDFNQLPDAFVHLEEGPMGKVLVSMTGAADTR